MTPNKYLVQKYGGTSVSTAERRQQVIGHVRRARENGYQVAIVVSAMGRHGDPYATDTLLDLLRNENPAVDNRDYDMVFVCGEIISAALMTHLLKLNDIPSIGLTGAQAGIYTNNNHSEAEILKIDTQRLRYNLDAGVVPVVAGCQGIFVDKNDFTTLGRGGSDTSGVALGVALNADRVEIFTDVQGVARVDPRLLPQTYWLSHIHYDSMLEMARFGAGVIHPRAVRSGRDGNVPIEIRSTFTNIHGTEINNNLDQYPIVGLAMMGPLASFVLDKDTLGLKIRLSLEKKRLIMSLLDQDTGRLILGISTEKFHELSSIKEEFSLDGKNMSQEQAWVSLIGNQVSEIKKKAGLALEKNGVEVLFQDGSNRRHTFVVPIEAGKQCVEILYQELISNEEY